MTEHLDRSRFLGGSDAAAVMGVSPWATPVQLWREKTGREVRKVDPIRERVFARGKRLEPVIIEMVLDKLRDQGHEVECVTRNQRYADPEHAFLSCEIDAEFLLDGEHINMDAKSVHSFARKKWGEEDTEDVPIEYAAQFMHGLMVTGRSRCLVAALIGLDDVAIYWVSRDDETIAAMRAKLVAFWHDHVLADVPPDPQTYDDITDLFPRDNGQAIVATPEIADAVRKLSSARAQLAIAKQTEEYLSFKVADFVSPHAELTFDGRVIATWKGQGHTSFRGKDFAAAHPELHEQFVSRSTVRVLRIPKGKK